MGGRQSTSYHATDLITEIMGGGASSRLYQRLVKEQRLFSHIECYHFGSIDPGLLTIEGKLIKGVTLEAAEAAVQAEIDRLLQHGVTDKELQKAKHRTESVISFEDMSLMNRANNLAFYELLGDAEGMNKELDKYRQVSPEQLLATAQTLLTESNSNTLYYRAAG
jgi:predicted Zn-dependent peptidase